MIFWNILESFGIFWNFLESFETFWNFWFLLEPFEIFGLANSFEMLKICLKDAQAMLKLELLGHPWAGEDLSLKIDEPDQTI